MDVRTEVDTPDLTPKRDAPHYRRPDGTWSITLGPVTGDLTWHGDADGARSLAEQWALLARTLAAVDEGALTAGAERAARSDAHQDHAA